MNILTTLNRCYQHWNSPKYVILKGIHIHNRCLLFLAKEPKIVKTYEYGEVLQASVYESYKGEWEITQYWERKPYKVIWTYKQLIDARRKLGKGLRAVMYDDFSSKVKGK